MPVDSFKWVENESQFNKYLKKQNQKKPNKQRNSDEEYFFDVNVQYAKNLYLKMIFSSS